MRISFAGVFCCLFVLSVTLSFAQQTAPPSADSLTHEKFLTLVNFSKDQSYLTFGNGLGNQQPILFEARLSPSYFISSNHRKWAIMMNPQVQVRMLDEKSLPIQVPSYRFYLTYYRNIQFWEKTFLQKIFYNDAIWFASVSHHSNGQSGNPYLNDSTQALNLTQGSFAVNFITLGVASYTLKPAGRKYFSLRELKVHTELYPYGWCNAYLRKSFGFYRLFGTFGFGGPLKEEKVDWLNRWLQNSSFEVKTGWIFGAYNGYSPVDLQRRLIVDATYKYYPPWFDEIAFFLRFYSGQDYYNIYYEKQLRTLTIGITSNTIKLSSAIRVLGKNKYQYRKQQP